MLQFGTPYNMYFEHNVSFCLCNKSFRNLLVLGYLISFLFRRKRGDDLPEMHTEMVRSALEREATSKRVCKQ